MRLLERALPLIWIIWPWEETSVSQSQSGRFLLSSSRIAMMSRMKIEVRGKAFLALISGPGAAGPSLNSLLSGLRRLIRIMLFFHFPGGESDGHAEEGGHLLRIRGVELLLVERHVPERIERLRLDPELLFEGLGDVFELGQPATQIDIFDFLFSLLSRLVEGESLVDFIEQVLDVEADQLVQFFRGFVLYRDALQPLLGLVDTEVEF